MEYLIKDQTLELKYVPGKGAWTYHIEIPNTKHIIGKWGSLKASGTIDNYKIESINLFTKTGQDKLISVNDTIRKAINKTGGDTVKVTLYLLTLDKKITEKEILDTFIDAGVLAAFNNLSVEERNEIIGSIMSQKLENTQTKTIIKHINKLSEK
jgi:Domain of unknown function (DUF1905)